MTCLDLPLNLRIDVMFMLKDFTLYDESDEYDDFIA